MERLPKLITKEEMIDKFKDEKQYSNWIALKLKLKTYKKIRNNLYALIDPSTNDIYSTKFEIASKISNTSFVCYHSALEYYGFANQVFGVVLVCSLTKFNNLFLKIMNIYANPSKALSLSMILQVKEFEFHLLKKQLLIA